MIIERTSEDGLEKQSWCFYLITSNHSNIELRLVGYDIQRRETKRHKFKADWRESYDRYKDRSSGLKMERVPLPDDVTAEARQKAIDMIIVVK